MSTSIMFELSHKIGLICCHKAQQHHATPEIKLIRSAQQTCRSNASTCLNQRKQKIWQRLLIAAAQRAGGLCVPASTKRWCWSLKMTSMAIKVINRSKNWIRRLWASHLLIVAVLYSFHLVALLHLKKGNRLLVAVRSEMIWNSILLNWLLPV